MLFEGLKNEPLVEAFSKFGPGEFEKVVLSDISKNLIFVTSFSEEFDDLNQWRAYSPKPGDISIGFKSAALTSLVDTSNSITGLERCLYTNEEQREFLSILITTSLNDDGSFDSPFFFLAARAFLPRIKNISFQKEKEWRLICFNHSPHISKNTIDFKEARSMIIPFVKIKLPKDDLGISKIIIGPTPHREEAKIAIEQLLEAKSLTGVEVKNSKIPYRNW